MALSFTVSKHDRDVIEKIAERAWRLDRQHNGRTAQSKVDWLMDFTATHASGNPLRLSDLLAANDFNFAHDAFGIARHLNRETGELEDFFSPRFSQPERIAA